MDRLFTKDPVVSYWVPSVVRVFSELKASKTKAASLLVTTTSAQARAATPSHRTKHLSEQMTMSSWATSKATASSPQVVVATPSQEKVVQ